MHRSEIHLSSFQSRLDLCFKFAIPHNSHSILHSKYRKVNQGHSVCNKVESSVSVFGYCVLVLVVGNLSWFGPMVRYNASSSRGSHSRDRIPDLLLLLNIFSQSRNQPGSSPGFKSANVQHEVTNCYRFVVTFKSVFSKEGKPNLICLNR